MCLSLRQLIDLVCYVVFMNTRENTSKYNLLKFIFYSINENSFFCGAFMFKQTFQWMLLPAAAAVLVACGGGSGDKSATTDSSKPFLIQGTAATGAAIVGGVVRIYDASGSAVSSGSTDANGKYSLSVPMSAIAPFVVEVDLADQKIYSVFSDKVDSQVNANQLTNTLAAILSKNGNPELLVNELRDESLVFTAQSIESKKELIKSSISPVKIAVESLGQNVQDFHNGIFDADGTGLDKLLDATNVLTTTARSADEANTVNVQISFNLASDLNVDRQMTGLQFERGDSISQIASSASLLNINAANLPPTELGGMYLEFLERMRVCYSLPKSQRVSGFTILAQECKDIFKGSDPENFLDGGFKPGENRFAGMFLLDQPPVFKQALSPLLIHNISGSGSSLKGGAVIAFRAEDAEANYYNFKMVVEVATLNGNRVFSAVGDQNQAEFYVNAEAKVDNFPLKSNNSDDYISSGYSVWLPASIVGRDTVKKAILTTPNGATVTMAKNGNRRNLWICRPNQNPDLGEVCNGIPSFIQGFRYISEQRNANGEFPISIRQVRTNLVYSRTQDATNTSCEAFKTAYGSQSTLCPRTDSEIESQMPGGLWQAEYHFNDNTKLILKTRNPVRALSNRELAASSGPNSKAARLTTDSINALKTLSQLAVDDGRAFSNWTDVPERPIWAPLTGPFNFEWIVEAGQEAPRMAKAIGRVHYYQSQNQIWNRDVQGVDVRPNWEDEIRFRNSTRNAKIKCELTNASADVSCGGVLVNDFDRNESPLIEDLDISNVTSDYAPGAWMSTSLLWTIDNTNTNIMRIYNWYDPN